MKSQTDLIRKHLKSGLSIDIFSARYLFGCENLSGRISELRDLDIVKEKVNVISFGLKKRITRYSIKK